MRSTCGRDSVRRKILLAALPVLLAATAASAQPAPASYRIDPLPTTAAELAKLFTPSQIEILEMLNRRDRAHLTRADPPTPGLIVPDTWSEDPLAYSPFPREWPAAAASPKAIVVDQPFQAFAAYESGRLVRWGPVSSGRKETPTPDGTFTLTWRARSRRSTDNEDWLLEWYFNFVNERGVSFHLFDLPGYPASHACVRMLLRDAQWLYGWGEQWRLEPGGRKVATPGTPVVILGTYPFGTPPAWLSLDALASPRGLPADLPSASRGFAPRTPLHARSRGPVAPLRSRGSLAALVR
jgi:lipoprotein-anchoring transpeptidase ErfK/SrfK